MWGAAETRLPMHNCVIVGSIYHCEYIVPKAQYGILNYDSRYYPANDPVNSEK